MLLCQLGISGDDRGLEALSNERRVDQTCALHVDALQPLVDVC